MDVGLAVAGFFVGIVVGLTGMGGGALMTPVLVLFFGIQPLAAVSSDLVASAIMKPVGGFVHLRRGTVHLQLVKWLVIGSVPSAFCGVLLLRALGSGESVQQVVKTALGVALLVASASLIYKAYTQLAERSRRRAGTVPRTDASQDQVVKARPLPTVIVGIVGGLVVGMTSVGSGSLIIIALLALYPTLQASQLVGTDLIQAVPLVAAAALGHLLFGDFQLDVTTSLLIGSIPGVYLGARVSSRAPAGFVRRALALVLLASGLKLLGVSNVALGWTLLAVLLLGPPLWAWVRFNHGLPPLARPEMKQRRRPNQSDEETETGRRVR
ncbi:sulfite exporter TauE/SafE family protein [soil metagenome]